MYLYFGTCRQVICEMFIVLISVLKILVEIKWYLRLYLAQIMHSNGKILFSWRTNCLSKFLWCAAHVKLFFLQVLSFKAMRVACEMFIVWSVPTLSRKWYLRYLTQTVHSIRKILFPLTTAEKTVNMWFNGKIHPLLINILSVNFRSSGQLQNVSFSKHFA